MGNKGEKKSTTTTIINRYVYCLSPVLLVSTHISLLPAMQNIRYSVETVLVCEAYFRLGLLVK